MSELPIDLTKPLPAHPPTRRQPQLRIFQPSPRQLRLDFSGDVDQWSEPLLNAAEIAAASLPRADIPIDLGDVTTLAHLRPPPLRLLAPQPTGSVLQPVVAACRSIRPSRVCSGSAHRSVRRRRGRALARHERTLEQARRGRSISGCPTATGSTWSARSRTIRTCTGRGAHWCSPRGTRSPTGSPVSTTRVTSRPVPQRLRRPGHRSADGVTGAHPSAVPSPAGWRVQVHRGPVTLGESATPRRR